MPEHAPTPDREELIRILAGQGIRFPEAALKDVVTEFADLKRKIALVRQALESDRICGSESRQDDDQ